MVLIPSGTFEMGAENSKGFADEFPKHKVKINSFWMDINEVTNAQFKKFVEHLIGYFDTKLVKEFLFGLTFYNLKLLYIWPNLKKLRDEKNISAFK